MASGGVDSMFLADFVVNTKIKPVIVHFQHGIRNNDEREARLVEEFSMRNALEFHLGKGNGLAEASNQEALAREQRWDFAESVISHKPGRAIVLTAHHHDDNIEHFYMSAARGRQLTALTMQELMKVRNPDNGLNYTRFKPLLDIEKDEIYEQARRRSIAWIEDPTNKDLDHERNLFRNKIVPDMMEIRNVRKSMRKLFREIEQLRGGDNF